MAYSWVEMLITIAGNFFGKLFELNVINTDSLELSIGECLLYYALASIVISFVFRVHSMSTITREGQIDSKINSLKEENRFLQSSWNDSTKNAAYWKGKYESK